MAAITALPETTVRLLGSAAAITTPVDVIKELLDNALDAEATSVDVLVSANLIGSIQVRDNGHGIQADDYDSLGRMGHTSKLTSFEELKTFGEAHLVSGARHWPAQTPWDASPSSPGASETQRL